MEKDDAIRQGRRCRVSIGGSEPIEIGEALLQRRADAIDGRF
jgi:hypothetical protein